MLDPKLLDNWDIGDVAYCPRHGGGKQVVINTDSHTIIVGLLFESDEWSDHKLASEIDSALNADALSDASRPLHEVRMIDMQALDAVAQALACDVLVSRVFASALNRGHERALEQMDELLSKLEESSILLLNEPRAHRFEIDKFASTRALQESGIAVPRIFQRAYPENLQADRFQFPCIIKPNCSGRTTDTSVLQNNTEADAFIESAPHREFIVQEYIRPDKGFITRIEIIGGKAALVVKRSVAENGLSAYRFGSTYELYDDVPGDIIADAEKAANVLGFIFGSFDIIETDRGNFFIDANSVSNVSEDCTEIFGMDLMKEHAKEIVRIILGHKQMTSR